MRELELNDLARRILAGEKPTRELWALRNTKVPADAAQDIVEALGDVWGAAMHVGGLVPPLEAAKAIVHAAMASGEAYPLLTNDGRIFDILSADERAALVRYVTEQTREPLAGTIWEQFVDALLGNGP